MKFAEANFTTGTLSGKPFQKPQNFDTITLVLKASQECVGLMGLTKNPPELFHLPTLTEVTDAYKNARNALHHGSFELAARMGFEENDLETQAVATILCGGLKRGLKLLETADCRQTDTPLYLAYAYLSD